MKQLESPSADGWIKKMWCIDIQWNTTYWWKEWNIAICSNMVGPTKYTKLNEQDWESKYYMITLKMKQTKQKQEEREKTGGYQRGIG